MGAVTDETLRTIWGLGDHIPAVHHSRWEDYIPNNFRAVACMAPQPVAVTERRPAPFSSTSKPLTQLLLSGEALLYALDELRFGVSVVSNRLVQAYGNTILLIEQRKDGEILACPWSHGELRKNILKRLIAMRRLPAPRLSAAEAYLAERVLPRCRAAISVVGHLGIENPGTNILASGGDCPISVTIGSQSIHFALDHRVFDPTDAAILYERFFRALAQ